MSTLVTGGKGFLGAELVRRLVSSGHDVVCLDLKTTPGRLADVEAQVTFVGGGLGGVEMLEHLIREHNVNRIAHMVFTSSAESAAGIHTEIATMVMGTVDVLEAARRAGIDRVVFPSSIHYYGPQWLHGEIALGESAPSLASTIYGVGKHLNEVVTLAYESTANMSIVSLRLPAIYGPNAEVGARGVNIAAVRAARGEPAIVPYAPDQSVCIAYVDDVADCLASALMIEAPTHDTYNVGGTTITYGEIADVVKHLVPDSEVAFDLHAAASDLPYLIDDSRARQELGLQHRAVDSGMLEVVNATRTSAGLPPLETPSRSRGREQ